DHPSRRVAVSQLKDEMKRLRTQLDDRDQYADELSEGEKIRPVPLELVFHLKPKELEGTPIVRGRRGSALKFSGESKMDNRPASRWDPAHKPFTVGSWCQPTSSNGVVVALGGMSQGFSLFIEDGHPCMAVRSAGHLSVARGHETVALNDWNHIAGMLTAHGELRVFLNGKSAGESKSAAIAARPVEGYALGA